MLTFQILSDIHLEVYEECPDASEFLIPRANILILAGDICRLHKRKMLEKFLHQVCPMFQAVLYVMGNHEYYWVKGCIPKTMEELFSVMTEIKEGIPNLYILNRDTVVIDDVCVAGCTLWSRTVANVPKNVVKIHEMNTCKYNSMFQEDLAFLEQAISFCQNKNLKLVVVTHHCPTYTVCDKVRDRKRAKYESLYASNLEYLMAENKIHTWVCGHIHKNFDIKINGTRVVANQKGKPREQLENFHKEKVIVI
jgi:predicted phosphodiesterase